MFVRVPSNQVAPLLSLLIKAKPNQCVSLTVRQGILRITTISSFVVMFELPCSTDIDVLEDVSIGLDKTMMLLKEGGTDIVLSFVLFESGDVVDKAKRYSVRIEQDNLSFMPSTQYELPMFVEWSKYGLKNAYRTINLMRAAICSRTLSSIAAVTKESPSDVLFHSNKFYICYSNTVYVESNMPFIDCTVSHDAIQQLSTFLRGVPSINVDLDYEAGVLIAAYDSRLKFAFPITRLDYYRIKTLDDFGNSLVECAIIDFTRYADLMSILLQSKTSLMPTLSICKSSLGILMMSNNVRLDYSSNEDVLFSFNLSIHQLSALWKLFGDFSGVHVLKGDKIVCFQMENRQLLMSTMIY